MTTNTTEDDVVDLYNKYRELESRINTLAGYIETIQSVVLQVVGAKDKDNGDSNCNCKGN